MPVSETPPTTKLVLNGRPLQSSEDVARFFGVPHGTMIHTLYRAKDQKRYTEFEIPKRTGGLRKISSPVGMVRQLQDTLKPLIQLAYDAHPSAHGFIENRSVVSNAESHTNKRWVLNIDLKDFFPSINFGRIRGLFMAPPFELGAAAATVCAQICTHKNGLPQGASTSPILSNFIATSLDRKLRRLARQNRMTYSRYADDITFSTDLPAIPINFATFEQTKSGDLRVIAGPTLERAILECGFAINPKKVRLQGPHERQNVTGLTVNNRPNVTRKRIRKVRAMIHAWRKFGIDSAAREHFRKYAKGGSLNGSTSPAKAFRNIVYGELSFIKMVRGADDPVFLNICSKLVEIDLNPSKFVREVAFGASDYDVFISHASEDKAEIARPIFQACEQLGIKTFLDEKHIGWGQSFTCKINTALGSARTVLAIISERSVNKDWPVAEVNAALSLEISGQKKVIPVMVGRPDLSFLPLISHKRYLIWNGDPFVIAKEIEASLNSPQNGPAPMPVTPVDQTGTATQQSRQNGPKKDQQSWFGRLFNS